MANSQDVWALPLGVWVMVGVLIVVQLGLMAFALMDLARRERVTGGHKWIWLVVILLGNMLGPLLYLAVGRAPPLPASDAEGPRPPAPDRAQRAADVLYGKREKP